MKMLKRALTAFLAAAFAATLCVAPAFAEGSALVDPPTYTVSVSGGNQGTATINGKSSITVAAGTELSGATVEVRDVNSKYFVKGLRSTSVNNAYIRDFVVQPDAVHDDLDGTYSMTLPTQAITQNTDYVVAYGIKGDVVSYTVQYMYGDTMLGSEQFTAQLGDKPAPVAKYFEGYIPYANQETFTLNSAGQVITFDYYKLPPTYRTEYVDGGIVIVGEEGTTVVNPVTPAEAEAAGGAVPIVGPDGEVILDADGNPLAAPITEENLDDEANPLAGEDALAGDTSGAAGAASILSWLLPLLAAIVVAGIIVFFALVFRNRRRDNDPKAN